MQTYNPDSEPIRRVLLHDFEGWSANELKWRKALAYPPYTRMASIRIDGDHPELTARVARELGQRLGQRMPPRATGSGCWDLRPRPSPGSRAGPAGSC